MINEQVSNTDSVYYGITRKNLLDLISGTPKRVLEIGCGDGATLAALKRRGAGYVCGLEINPQVAEKTRSRPELDNVIVGDVEAALTGIESGSFDVIVASHVLEHLIDPWKAVREIHRILTKDGQLVGAIPNIRHISILLGLINGNWKYEDSGILDWTHLRFFTKSGISQLLSQGGFSPQLLPDIAGGKSLLLSRLSFGLMNDYAAYAYNFKGTKLS